MEKDFKFYPCKLKSPKFLSQEQINEFNKNGFISPLQGFSKDEIGSQRKYFDKLLSQLSEAPHKGDAEFLGEDKKTYIPILLELLPHKAPGNLGDNVC